MASYENTVEHHVAMASFALQQAVSKLWELRLNPLTADAVLFEEGALLAARGTLSTLVEDIRAANDKRDAVAPLHSTVAA